MEEWRPIPAFSLYSASSLGRIRRNAITRLQANGVERRYPELIMSLHARTDGYLTVGVTDDTGQRTNMFVARLVAFAFLPNPENLPEVDHIDRQPSNNQVSNLRWCSRSTNNMNRCAMSNTDEKYISREVIERFRVNVPNSRRKKVFATLESAIQYRDSLTAVSPST